MYLDRRIFDSYVPEIWLHIIKSKRKVVHFMSLAIVKVGFKGSLLTFLLQSIDKIPPFQVLI
jgi:hypothetical protein